MTEFIFLGVTLAAPIVVASFLSYRWSEEARRSLYAKSGWKTGSLAFSLVLYLTVLTALSFFLEIMTSGVLGDVCGAECILIGGYAAIYIFPIILLAFFVPPVALIVHSRRAELVRMEGKKAPLGTMMLFILLLPLLFISAVPAIVFLLISGTAFLRSLPIF